MVSRLIACSLVIVATAALVSAHGDATHIMGTITAVQGNHLTIKTQDGKSEMVMIGKATKYMIGTKAATPADLTVGRRVVIDAKIDPKMKMYSAEEVRIGVATPATNSSGKVTASPDTHAGHK